MRLSKKLIGTFACASALAMVGVAVNEAANPTTNVEAAYSAINNLIYSNGYKVPSVEVRAKFFTEGGSYINGKPEGIVVHETATPGASAEDEASYFGWAWSTSYTMVHALVDANQIIQIHTPNETVWGAGSKANARFIQIELCQETTQVNFAKSVNNYAYYIATLLKQYNLTPDNAEHDGAGTIWSHNAVSNYLGGTDHSDPTGYFAKWGYSMDQFYDLIVNKYNAIGGNVTPPTTTPDYSNAGKTQASGSPIASIEHAGNVAVWSQPGKNVTSQALKPKSVWKVYGKTLVNGSYWYQVGNNQWLDGKYLFVTGTNSIPVVNVSQPPVNSNLMGTTSNSGSPVASVEYKGNIAVWSNPGKTVTSQALKPGSKWKVMGKAAVNGRYWYQVGKTQWIDGQYLYVTGYSQIATVTPGTTTPDYSNAGKTQTTGSPVACVEYKTNVAVWSNPGKTVTSQALKPKSKWAVSGKVSVSGRWWYQVGKNQWLDGKYLFVTGTNSIPTVSVSQPPVSGNLMGQAVNAGNPIATVEYTGNVAVWSNPGKTVTSQALKPTTKWRVLGKRSVAGRYWYQVGKNQWLDGKYLYVTGLGKIATI